MKSTVPSGTGAAIRRDRPSLAYVSCPEFLKEGIGGRGLPAPGPRRHRRRCGRRVGRRRRRGALRAARRRARPHRRRLSGDDQARLERVPRDEDLVHQRDRQRLRGGRAPTSPRSRAAWAWTSGSARASCGPGSATAAPASPRTSSALKQLAGNTGYHFQLLNAVIEVNELQKRRVIGKLTKHLGSLVGKRIALLGLAFKPDTDDMREASSLVLSARLQGEGAERRRLRPGRRGAGRRAAAGRRALRLG